MVGRLYLCFRCIAVTQGPRSSKHRLQSPEKYSFPLCTSSGVTVQSWIARSNRSSAIGSISREPRRLTVHWPSQPTWTLAAGSVGWQVIPVLSLYSCDGFLIVRQAWGGGGVGLTSVIIVRLMRPGGWVGSKSIVSLALP